jgi:hypothetical protein
MQTGVQEEMFQILHLTCQLIDKQHRGLLSAIIDPEGRQADNHVRNMFLFFYRKPAALLQTYAQSCFDSSILYIGWG